MVAPRKRKKGKSQSSGCGTCSLVFVVQFVLVAIMMVTNPPARLSKRSTLRSLHFSKRSQPSYELPKVMNKQQRGPPERQLRKPYYEPPQSGGDAQLPLPVPGNMKIETVLPLLMARVRQNSDRPNGRLVNLGAGVRDQDPTFPLLDTGAWEALLADGAEHQGKLMAERFPDPKIKTAVAYITADSIGKVLTENGFDHDVDLLKIDIDSFDCHVVDSLLKTVRPTVIVMEVNVKFPANVRFAYLPGFTATDSLHDGHMEQCPFDSEKRGHVYGCSLAYQVHDLMWPRNYEILYLESNNAVYYDKRKKIPGLQDNVPLSMTELYQRGYWSMPNRRDSFSFNNELEPWQQYKAGEIFSYLQKTPLPFHGNHHVVIGDLVNNGFGPQPSLQHGCFDPHSGALNDAESDSGSCTWTVLPSR